MPGFNDFTCDCGQRIGWFGELADCPKCPSCGAAPDTEELQETERLLEEARQKLLAELETEDSL